MANSLHGIEQFLRYDGETGLLYWAVRKGPRALKGGVAGHLNRNGYIEIRPDRQMVMAHRAAWYLHYGKDPGDLTIDHINGNRADNRISNLRLATQQENNYNMKKRAGTASNLKGVSWHKGMQKWQAQIRVNGRSVYLGYYDDEDLAHLIYCEAAQKYHGEFARTA